MLTIHMSGLMYFNGCHAKRKEALVPDGTRWLPSHPDIPTHYASVWIESKDLKTSHWWPEQQCERKIEFKDGSGQVTETVYVTEFHIPERATVTFPDRHDKPSYFDSFERDLPKLKQLNNSFEVDLKNPEVIARVSIRGGHLAVYEFKKVASVKWTIEHPSNPMAIKANNYSITLKPEAAEIVFSNNSNLLADDYPPGHDCLNTPDPNNHFYLYSRLEKHRDGSGLVIPCYPTHLKPLAYKHAYFRKLASGRLSDSGCTGTCC